MADERGIIEYIKFVVDDELKRRAIEEAKDLGKKSAKALTDATAEELRKNAFEGLISRAILKAQLLAKGIEMAFSWLTEKLPEIFKAMYELAARVQDVNERFEYTFGPEGVKRLDKFSDSFRKMAGVSKSQLREMLTSAGNFAQGIGISVDKSAEFAQRVAELSGAIAAQGIPLEQAFKMVQGAIAGEGRALREHGIAVDHTIANRQALLATGKQNVDQLTLEEKAQAALNQMYQSAAPILGGLERAKNSLDGKGRQLRSTMQDIREEIALKMLPVFASFQDAMLAMVPNAHTAAEAISNVLVGSLYGLQAAVFSVLSAMRELYGFVLDLQRIDAQMEAMRVRARATAGIGGTTPADALKAEDAWKAIVEREKKNKAEADRLNAEAKLAFQRALNPSLRPTETGGVRGHAKDRTLPGVQMTPEEAEAAEKKQIALLMEGLKHTETRKRAEAELTEILKKKVVAAHAEGLSIEAQAKALKQVEEIQRAIWDSKPVFENVQNLVGAARAGIDLKNTYEGLRQALSELEAMEKETNATAKEGTEEWRRRIDVETALKTVREQLAHSPEIERQTDRDKMLVGQDTGIQQGEGRRKAYIDLIEQMRAYKDELENVAITEERRIVIMEEMRNISDALANVNPLQMMAESIIEDGDSIADAFGRMIDGTNLVTFAMNNMGKGSAKALLNEFKRIAAAEAIMDLARAIQQQAMSLASTASGNFVAAAVHQGSAHAFFMSALKWGAVAGALQVATNNMGGGGPSDTRGDKEEREQSRPTEVNIYLDPFNPDDPLHQRTMYETDQNVRERYGDNTNVNYRGRVPAGVKG